MIRIVAEYGVPSIAAIILSLVIGAFFTEPEKEVVFEPLPPIAIIAESIILRTDGTGVYDRTIIAESIELAWSGFVYDDEGNSHCEGGGIWTYNKSQKQVREVPPDGSPEDFVDWIVGSECEGLQEGWRFIFRWEPTKDNSWRGYTFRGRVQKGKDNA